MDELKNEAIKLMKKVLKKVGRVLLIPIIICIVVIILLSSFVYFITIDDGTYKEGDWSSTGYGTAVYQSGATVNSDGTVTTEKTAQNIWDELVNNGSNVDKYLSGPEALAKLMNVEMITKFPDMRPNPDDDIDWSKIDLTKNTVQGIIKFKKADKDGNISTMKYVDSAKFYDWIEKYNLTGDEATKQDLLSHYILVPNRENSTGKVDFSGEVLADVSERIVEAAKTTPTAGAGLCQAWVRRVYVNAGLENVGYIGAYQAYQKTCISNDRNNIPVGAAVYGTGSATLSDGSTNIYGHVGIYVGDINGDGQGDVMDNIGDIRTISLNDWIAEQERSGNTACGGTPGWLGWGWQSGSPTIIEDTTENKGEDTKTENGKIETSAKNYAIEVATWKQVDTTIETDDPNVKATTKKEYSITTTQVNYRALVDKYTMPFNLLWAFLVVGESENFVLDLADLVYNSQIEITISDNYTKNTDTEEWKYTQYELNKVEVRATEPITQVSKSTKFKDTKEPVYTTKKTVVTQTNTLDVSLTKANIWTSDTEVAYNKTTNTNSSPQEQNTVKGTEFPDKPDKTSDKYEHDNIEKLVDETYNEALSKYYATNTSTSSIVSNTQNMVINRNSIIRDIHVDIYTRYDNIIKTVNHSTENSKYITEPPVITEKTDPNSTEPNFVTLYNKSEYGTNRNNIASVSTWLFEIIETNQDTTNMVDLVKYLLYKATGVDYGVTELDLDSLWEKDFTNVGISGGSAFAEFLKSYENNALRIYMNGTSTDYGSVQSYVTSDKKQYKMYYTSFDGCLNFSYGIMVRSSDGILNNVGYFKDEGIDLQTLVNQYDSGQEVCVDVEIIDRIYLKLINDKRNSLKEIFADKGVTMKENQIDALVNVSYQYGNCGQYISGNDNIALLYKNYYEKGNKEEFKSRAQAQTYNGGRANFFTGSLYAERKRTNWILFDEGRYILSDGTEIKSNSSVVDFAMQFIGENHSRFTSYNPSNGVADVWYGADWCAMFVSYCYNECGLIPNVLPTPYASCSDIINKLNQQGNPRLKIVGNLGAFAGVEKDNYIPNPGDIIFFNWGDADVASHTGIVTSCDGSRVYTIEGNTSEGTYYGWNSSKVLQKDYSLDSVSIVGYISING